MYVIFPSYNKGNYLVSIVTDDIILARVHNKEISYTL